MVNTPTQLEYNGEIYLTPFRSIRYYHSRVFGIVQGTSASISAIASITTLCIIYRSHLRLSTSLNRLLFGLCVADAIASMMLMLGPLPIPQESHNLIWNARGTTATCDAAGFLTFFGTAAAPLYNCSLCLYYLAVIKYNLPDEIIRKKLEVGMHSVSILFPLCGAVIIQLKKAFNPMLTVCWIAPYPLNCDVSTSNVPCERGEGYFIPFVIFSIFPLLILPCVLAVSMLLMYFAIREQEKAMYQYSASFWMRRISQRGPILASTALARNPQVVDACSDDDADANPDDADHEPQDEDVESAIDDNQLPHPTTNNANEKKQTCNCLGKVRQWKDKRSLQRALQQRDISSLGRPNNPRNRLSRTIIFKALGYSLSYFGTYMFYIIIYVYAFLGVEPSFALEIIFRIFTPLQGFFNFLVYISPKIILTKKSNSRNITWGRAFLMTMSSRGPTNIPNRRTSSLPFSPSSRRLRL